MSSRVLGGWGGIGRSVSKTLGFQNAAQTAPFSRCANLGEERTGEAKKAELEVGASEKESRQEKNSQEKGQEDHQGAKGGEQRAKRSGFALPAFALFAVGLPLGYYFSDYTPFGKRKEHSHPSEFVKYTLVDKENVSSTAAIFRLKPSSSTTVDLDNPSLERAITSVEFKQPQLQIARSYTCLPQEDGQPVDELRFLIRREQKGEVSNFLHRLPVGAEIDVRGLHTEYVIPEDVKSMAWLVGGTGIAPAMQAADILGEHADVYILWASRRREDCIGGYNDNLPEKRRWSFWPGSGTAEEDRKIAGAEKGALVRQLENLKHRSASSQSRPHLTVDYHVDEEGALVKADEVRRMLQTLARSGTDNASGRNVLVVSGPEGFIAHWAGPKQWAGGREIQGPLRGVLSTLDLTGWDIVKL